MLSHPFDASLTPHRRERFRAAIAGRTKRVAVVLEDCHHAQNGAAILRTCDALGIHHVHVVTKRSKFRVNREVSRGVERFLSIHLHATIESAYAALRSDGFSIYASAFDSADAPDGIAPHAPPLEDGKTASTTSKHVDFESLATVRPVALVFGNELVGVSESGVVGADGTFALPMVGFTESLNISVAAGIVLYAVRLAELREAAAAGSPAGDMTRDEQLAEYERWIREQHPAAVRDFSSESPSPSSAVPFAEIDENGDEVDVYIAPGSSPPRKGPARKNPRGQVS